jgi:hypothetical protein
VKERELREAEARAAQQQQLTASEVSIAIQTNTGKAEYQRSLQQAAQIRALAEAEAEKAARIGIGQAIAVEEQVRAYGGPKFQVTQQVMNRFAEAIEQSRVDVVPRILIGGQNGGGASGGNVFEALLTMMLSEKLDATAGTPSGAAPPEVTELRNAIRSSLVSSIKRPPAEAPKLPGA